MKFQRIKDGRVYATAFCLKGNAFMMLESLYRYIMPNSMSLNA